MIYDILVLIQDLRTASPEWLTQLMLAASHPIVYIFIPMAIAAVIYWCIDKRCGDYILMNFACGVVVAHFLKDVFAQPRPWIADSRISPEGTALNNSGGYSLPSGHTVSAFTLYGSIIAVIRRRWATMLLGSVILTVMFSRMYLGVHTAIDLIAGVFLSIAVMAANWHFITVADISERNYNLVIAGYLMFFAAVFTIWYVTADEPSDIPRYAGILFGTLSGRFLEHRYVKFKIADRSLRRITGIAVFGTVLTSLLTITPYLLFSSGISDCAGGFMAAIAIFFIVPSVTVSLQRNTHFFRYRL